MEFTDPYLTEQIIAYIGNKRKLLPLVCKAIESTGLEMNSGLTFFDAFSGSGSVSRLAKALGFQLYTNDWEDFAYILNKGYVETNAKDIAAIFGSEEAYQQVIKEINESPVPEEDEQYIAKYYAPKEFDINNVDFNTERLFYTRENALALDKIRNRIEQLFPPDTSDLNDSKRFILLSELIYEAATHTNTSGVFKAYHKGFGGHGKDALARILKPIELHGNTLIDSKSLIHVYKEDANTLVKKLQYINIDIAYLDPPYNQHQYGSNYHLLNTVVRWDHIPEPLELNTKGVLKEKAAIRHDWVKTRSAYCYKSEATEVFADLIANLNARFILISYSTDGIIPFETMRDICLRKGKLSIVTNEYTKYRGGKQSNKRKNTNIEFILCIDTSKKSDLDSVEEIDSLLARKKILLLFKQKFSEEKILAAAADYTVDEHVKGATKGTITLQLKTGPVTLETDNFFEVKSPEEPEKMSLEELKDMYSILSPCICETKEEEISELLQKIYNEEITPESKLLSLLPKTLKKLASKKNHDKYVIWLEKIQALSTDAPLYYEKIKDELKEVDDIAQQRFTT